MILMNFFDHRVKEYPFENILFLLIETLIGFIIIIENTAINTYNEEV